MRKLSGFTNPSKANEAVFDEAVDDVSAIARKLIDSLVTNAPPRNGSARAPDSGAQGRVTIGVAGSLRPGCPASTRCWETNADAFSASSSSALAPVSRLSMP